MNTRHLSVLASVLTVMGLCIFAYKAVILDFPLSPQTQAALWDIEVHLTYQANNKPIKAALYLPRNTRRYAIVDENFISHGYGLTTVKDDVNRRATWSKRTADGKQNLYYSGTIRQIETTEPLSKGKKVPVPQPPSFQGAKLAAALALLSDIQEKSADATTLVAELTARLKHPKADSNVQLLLRKDHTPENTLALATHILALAGIPSRVVHGIRLEDKPGKAKLAHWLQVFAQGLWKSHDPETGNPGIPDEYFTWWRGQTPLVELSGGRKLEATISVVPNQEEAIRAALIHSQIATPQLVELSLFRLPLETQAVYRILLMVPMGALLLLVLRNIIGVKTFGTFMPILMALAFRETQLVWGIVLFSLVVALGLGIRFYLEHLKLLLVPRLASLLVIVVMLMAVISVLSHKLGFERGLSVALFPMVILTMTIERMCIVWEERGASESIQQGLGSLAVAALTYVVMSIPHVEHLLFVFPELLFLVLAGTLLMGRYTGFRLLELGRFKALAQ